MNHFLYLLVDLGALIVPFICSFHPRIAFYRHWKAVLAAIIIVSVPFLFWDAWFTKIGVWGFSDRYLTGSYLGNLPLEEVLFFICIPYSCLFTCYCLNMLMKKKLLKHYELSITAAVLLIAIVVIVVYGDRKYAVSSFGLLFIVLSLARWKKGGEWMRRFYFSYLVLLIPFFIVNGILTGAITEGPVVWYNDAQNMDIRVVSIPIEDFFYGMLLILSNVLIFEYCKKEENIAIQV